MPSLSPLADKISHGTTADLEAECLSLQPDEVADVQNTEHHFRRRSLKFLIQQHWRIEQLSEMLIWLEPLVSLLTISPITTNPAAGGHEPCVRRCMSDKISAKHVDLSAVGIHMKTNQKWSPRGLGICKFNHCLSQPACHHSYLQLVSECLKIHEITVQPNHEVTAILV